MRVFPRISMIGLLPLLAICAAGAQQPAQTDTSGMGAQTSAPHEPGTGSAQIAPASRAPKPMQQPDVRLDSKPQTNLDPTLDSAPEPPDLGLGASLSVDLGHDDVAHTPPGMLARSQPGNPRMVYFYLPHRSDDPSATPISSQDSTIVASRQADLVRAAAFHGYALKQSGWMYQQAICAPIQPDAEAVDGLVAADHGEGFILLHFVRHDSQAHVYSFSAIVPRASSLPVRVIASTHRGVENPFEFLNADTSGHIVNEALPPATLRRNMEPERDWIATSACIAELGGAYPHIPNEPSLDDIITTAPPPRLALRLDGKRDVIFTDRIDDTHYVVWDEYIAASGKMLSAHRSEVHVLPRPVTNPPVPQARLLPAPAMPPVKITPPPPSPLAGSHQ
jgi:hypothetical protein